MVTVNLSFVPGEEVYIYLYKNSDRIVDTEHTSYYYDNGAASGTVFDQGGRTLVSRYR